MIFSLAQCISGAENIRMRIKQYLFFLNLKQPLIHPNGHSEHGYAQIYLQHLGKGLAFLNYAKDLPLSVQNQKKHSHVRYG